MRKMNLIFSNMTQENYNQIKEIATDYGIAIQFQFDESKLADGQTLENAKLLLAGTNDDYNMLCSFFENRISIEKKFVANVKPEDENAFQEALAYAKECVKESVTMQTEADIALRKLIRFISNKDDLEELKNFLQPMTEHQLRIVNDEIDNRHSEARKEAITKNRMRIENENNGKILAKIRKDYGFETSKDFAEAFDIPEPQIWAWEERGEILPNWVLALIKNKLSVNDAPQPEETEDEIEDDGAIVYGIIADPERNAIFVKEYAAKDSFTAISESNFVNTDYKMIVDEVAGAARENEVECVKRIHLDGTVSNIDLPDVSESFDGSDDDDYDDDSDDDSTNENYDDDNTDDDADNTDESKGTENPDDTDESNESNDEESESEDTGDGKNGRWERKNRRKRRGRRN